MQDKYRELRAGIKHQYPDGQPISKGDDIKIKMKVSPFFLLLPVYLPFIAVLSLFYARLHGWEAALEFREIQVK